MGPVLQVVGAVAALVSALTYDPQHLTLQAKVAQAGQSLLVTLPDGKSPPSTTLP